MASQKTNPTADPATALRSAFSGYEGQLHSGELADFNRHGKRVFQSSPVFQDAVKSGRLAALYREIQLRQGASSTGLEPTPEVQRVISELLPALQLELHRAGLDGAAESCQPAFAATLRTINNQVVAGMKLPKTERQKLMIKRCKSTERGVSRNTRAVSGKVLSDGTLQFKGTRIPSVGMIARSAIASAIENEETPEAVLGHMLGFAVANGIRCLMGKPWEDSLAPGKAQTALMNQLVAGKAGALLDLQSKLSATRSSRLRKPDRPSL